MDGREAAIGEAQRMDGDNCDDPVSKCYVCPKTRDEMLKKCDGGAYGKATKALAAYNGKSLSILPGGKKTQFLPGLTSVEDGKIWIRENMTECKSVEVLIFELFNMSQASQFAAVEKRAKAGQLSRNDYITAIEQIEYQSALSASQVESQCLKAWCCTEAQYSWAKGKTFPEYLKAVTQGHKDAYGNQWDERYKDAYEKAHGKK